MKIILLIISSILLSACSLLPTSNNNTLENINLTGTPASNNLLTPIPSTIKLSNQDMVGLNTKYGQIVIKLYKQDAPNSVVNFIKKIESGFYNGLTFHRVEPGFVVQGGDPLGNGTGGGSQKSEINAIPFVKGSVGLARGPDKNITNDSQFFICLTDENCQSLTGDYVNIGQVVSGMEFVSKIVVGDKILQFTDKTK
jgi:cyclophilin family peptidyl-prolyl cis-trans isomerase